MPKTKKAKSEAAKSGGRPESGSRVATVLKWVGGGTAVLSLVFGLRQLTVMVSDIRDRQRQATELIATSRVQQDAMDYRAAWASLGKAAALRANESGIRIAQEDLAMAWLENIRGSQGAAPFTAIVDSLAPVLSRGVVAGEGPRKADLLAHLGWADFLRWRDAQGGADPAERYRQALAVDSQNVYAHAMLAHWMLWNGDGIEAANRHWAIALGSGRDRPYVRRLQVAALANLRAGEGDLEILRMANDMRKGGEPMAPGARDQIWSTYYFRLISSPDEGSIAHLLAAVPPEDQVATYRWVFENSGYVEAKGFLYQYALARLQDAAGQEGQALATYRSARAAFPPDAHQRIRNRMDAAIARLSRSH